MKAHKGKEEMYHRDTLQPFRYNWKTDKERMHSVKLLHRTYKHRASTIPTQLDTYAKSSDYVKNPRNCPTNSIQVFIYKEGTATPKSHLNPIKHTLMPHKPYTCRINVFE
jgi:hypothetical protein